jgi:hypothetical protein
VIYSFPTCSSLFSPPESKSKTSYFALPTLSSAEKTEEHSIPSISLSKSQSSYHYSLQPHVSHAVWYSRVHDDNQGQTATRQTDSTIWYSVLSTQYYLPVLRVGRGTVTQLLPPQSHGSPLFNIQLPTFAFINSILVIILQFKLDIHGTFQLKLLRKSGISCPPRLYFSLINERTSTLS